MKMKHILENARSFSRPYRVTNGKKFHLADVEPSDTGKLKSEDKPRAQEALATGVQALAELQDMLYAQDRGFWDDYMHAYEETIRATATEDCPWYVVPADNKWFTRAVVAAAVIDALDSLKLHYPKVDDAKRAELAEARKALLAK